MVVALLIVAVAPALANDTALLEELRQRATANKTGTVEGRLYIERPRPNAPDEPRVGAGVLVVPRSEDLLDRLERLKRESRESMRGFREAAPGVRAALDAYELRLWRAGYPDAMVRTASDASGAFRVTLPAGAWLLAAERSVFVPTQPPRSTEAPTASALDPLARYSAMPYQHFLPMARMTGFDAVTLWLRELTVSAGETVALELHDRGVWLSGVAEETEVPRRVRFAPGIKR